MSEHESESTTLPAIREPDMVRLAEDLVASASDRGLALTGEGGLLTALTRLPGPPGRWPRLRPCDLVSQSYRIFKLSCLERGSSGLRLRGRTSIGRKSPWPADLIPV